MMTLLRKVDDKTFDLLSRRHLVAGVAEEELVVVACSPASRAHLAVDALPRLQIISQGLDQGLDQGSRIRSCS